MKHALIVLAHHDLPNLMDVLAQFGPGFDAYVHLDRKARLPAAEIQQLRAMPCVRYLGRRYRVNWGGMNIVRAILRLSRKALEDPEVGYLHMITGTDRLIVRPSEFKEFFLRNAGKEYLLHFPLPTPYWKDGGMSRLTYYHFLDQFDVRTPWGKRCRDLLLRVQEKFGVQRRIPARSPKLYGGSMSWSLSRSLMAHVVERLAQDRAFFRRFLCTYCPDELVMQTLIMNSPFASKVVNDSLRYIDYTRAKSPHPYVLGPDSWDAMLASGKLLARKIDRPFSNGLIERLRDRVRE